MANVKISQLPSLSTLSGADEFPVVHSGTTYNITANAITAFATIDVPVANVSGIGNIATVNLNANASTVLAGDGTWVAQSGGSSTGDITFVNTTISAPNDDQINLQALDNDGLVNSQLRLDPNNTLTRLQGWSGQDSNSWTTADWATGSYTTGGGGTIGAIEFTGAPAMIAYINSIQNPDYVFVQVNGGPLLASQGWGGSSTNITFYVAELPATDPTTVTDFAYYFNVSSFIEMDYDAQELNIEGNGLDVTISTRAGSDLEINSNRNLNLIGNASYSITNFSTTDPIRIQTDAGVSGQTWEFRANGTLIVPPNGSTSIESVDSNDISISATSTSGPATASLQNSNDGSITAAVDVSPTEVTVEIDTNTWRFDAAGNLTLPSNTFAVNYANGDPVVIGGGGSANTGNIYFNQSAILSNQSNAFVNLNDDVNGKLSLGTTSGSNVQIAVNDIANATGAIWVYDATGNLTLPGNTSSINYANGQPYGGSGGSSLGDLTATGNVIYANSTGTPAGFVNFDSGAGNAMIVGTNINMPVQIISNSTNTAATWTFAPNGNLTLPTNTSSINYANGAPYGGSGGGTFTNGLDAQYANTITTTGTPTGFTNYDLGNGSVAFGTNSVAPVFVVSGAGNGVQQWGFEANGNLTLPAGTPSINYANGAPYGGSTSTYGNTEVNTYLNDGAFTGDFIPNGNATQSLGNITNQWLDLWVSNATIYLNAVPLGVAGNGVLQFNGNDIVTSGSNVINTGNVETTGNVAGAYIIGDGSQLTNITASTGDVTFDNTTVQGDNSSLNLSAGPDYTATLAYLQVRAGDVPSHIHLDTGDNATYDLLIGNDSKYVQVGAGGNVSIASDGGAQYIWNYDIDGSLKLATVNSESAQFVGTRKIIGGLSVTSPYSTELTGGTPTLAYTSTSGTSSAKITFAVQSGGSGFQWEQFDVVATPSQDVGGAVNFVVSNRVKGSSTIPDTVVTATMNGNLMEISLTLDAAQTSGGFASFDAVEFGLMVD